jgi:hypothetical protein
VVRTALLLSAFAVTLLPIPLIYFGVLPAYRTQATFLIFYTPFICLLTLCYLFYVRESLARAMFADVLNPPLPPDPYFREPFGDRLRRLFRHLKQIVLGILPVALVIASLYCASRYLSSLDQSVAAAAQSYRTRSAADTALLVPTDRRKAGSRRLPSSAPSGKGSSAAVDSAADSLPAASDSAAVRTYVLRTTAIDDIPQLLELTILYLAGFVALLTAVSLMALKEYARDALGLSDRELVFGRPSAPEG